MYCIKKLSNGEVIVSNLTLKEAKKWMITESDELDWDAEDYYFIDKE